MIAALTKWYSSEKSKPVKLCYVNCTASNFIEYILKNAHEIKKLPIRTN